MDKLTHQDNIANDVVTERNVSGDGNHEVNTGSGANTRNNNTDHARWGVVLDFIYNRKHLDKTFSNVHDPPDSILD